MEVEQVKELVESFSKEGLTGLKLKCEAFEIELEKAANVPQVEMAATLSKEHLMVHEAEVTAEVTHEIESSKTIASPIVGVFYQSNSPKAEPFVKVGQTIKKGDIVGIIEAMKLMNEVEAEEEGEVVEVLVQNEEMVEYGQPLFRLK